MTIVRLARLLLPLALLESSVAAERHEARRLTSEEVKHFQAAADYSRSQKGVAVLVMRRGEVVFEDYAPGWADKPHLLASGTKSFAGVMAVCAVQDGLLSLDEKISATLTEWRSDPRKAAVTIRQLLSLSSGVDGGDNGSVPSYQRALTLAEAKAAPGERFSYGPIPFQCFGEVMRRKLAPRGESVEAYLHRRVLDPIGLKVGFWRKDADGNLNLPAGAFLTAREWVKFGELIRLEGKWQGAQLIPAHLIAECFKPATANSAYGLTFWLLGGDASSAAVADGLTVAPKARRAVEERQRLRFQPPRDLVAAMGKGKQRCYIIPSLELVIVRLGDSVGREFNDLEFLALALAP